MSQRRADNPCAAVARKRPSALNAGSRTGSSWGQLGRCSGLSPETSQMFTVPPQVPLTSQRLSGLNRNVLTSPHSFSVRLSGGLDKSARVQRLITPLSWLLAASQRPSALNAIACDELGIGSSRDG